MNNLNNISEYRKIIFVNGLDESSPELLNNEELTGGLSTLSKNYPFVVFITKNSSISTDEFPITNMWFDGTRLTRFIGIDKLHNSINIGDHTLQLKFDYKTGLLGIFDENTLENLTLINYSYIDINGNEVSLIDNPNGITTIDISSKDNKFKLKFRYNIQQDEENTNFNISSISKALSYKYKNISKLSGYSVNIDDRNTQEDYEFTYKIVESTNGVSIPETFASEYAQDIVCPLSMILYLNPISYDIYINNQRVSDIIYLEKNTEYTITLNFNPNGISSSSTHRLSVNMLSEDYETIDILSNNSVDIFNGSCQFNIRTTNDVEFNTIKYSTINFKVSYQNDHDNNGIYNDLNKSITIALAGDESDKYFYFGYEDPRNNTSLLKNYSDKVIGEYIWDDEEIGNTQHEDDWYLDKTFFCAIPIEYSTIVKPRWNAWTENENNLCSCLEWFNIENYRIELNGINYIIYSRKMEGKFYGRIK